jgi:hypothetical protein
MSDASEHTSAEHASGVEGSDDPASREIARSLSSIWLRFSGQRPASMTVEMEPNVVRCTIGEGTGDQPTDEDAEAAHEPHLTPDSPSFSYDATAAVTRATGRRVVAFIPKRDKKALTATQTFILDQPRRRF